MVRAGSTASASDMTTGQFHDSSTFVAAGGQTESASALANSRDSKEASPMELTDLHALSATDAARLVREGAISSEQLVAACLARVRETDPRIEAWAFLDPDHALGQARAADEFRLSGAPIGPLHGVPIGIKDIIDTADVPTENGSVLHAGRTPSRDAAVVALLRAAGAVIMGKTVTTEFACGASGKTRHPHDSGH